MKDTNALGLRVVGITATLLIVLFGLYWGGRALLFNKGADRSPLPQQGMALADRTRDTDGDGVADLIETTYYKTDPNKADTDGDGVSDLHEITSGRDPLIPGPNDESRPATGSKVTELKTHTQLYLSALSDDVPRDEILDQARLESYVEANRGTLLPTVTSDMMLVVPGEGKEAVAAYLDAISSTHNDAIKIVTSADIEAAYRLQVSSQQPQPMRDVVAALTSNAAVIEGVSAPSEIAALHTKLVAASRSLRDNVELLHKINQDFVGGLIAAKNIEGLGDVFQEIAADIKALEEKYGLE